MNEPDLRATMLELMGELANETITPEQYRQLEELLSGNSAPPDHPATL